MINLVSFAIGELHVVAMERVIQVARERAIHEFAIQEHI